MFISEIDLASPRLSRSSSQVSDDTTSIVARREGASAYDPYKKIMTLWTFSVKFSYDTQFTFGSLMFVAGNDENLELLTRGPAPERLVPVYGQPPYLPTSSSTLGGAYTSLNPYAGSYHRTARTSQGNPIGMSIVQSSTGTSSFSISAKSPYQDSSDDYPVIGESTCWNSADEGSLIIMVALAGAPSHDSSSRYPTIVRLEASDARTPNDRMIQNLNQDFNAVRLQTIMKSIQRMKPKGSPLITLPRQGAEAANLIVAERSADNHRKESFVGNRSNDRTR
jgi:hypothetical protein